MKLKALSFVGSPQTKLVLVVAAVSLGIAACKLEAPGKITSTPLTKQERARCLSEGGTPQWFGLSATEGCVVPPDDFGKVCTKSSECTAHCMAETRTCGALNAGEYEILDEGGDVQIVVVE